MQVTSCAKQNRKIPHDILSSVVRIQAITKGKERQTIHKVRQVQEQITCKDHVVASTKRLHKELAKLLTKLLSRGKKKKASLCDASHVSKSFSAKASEIFNSICLDDSTKLGLKTSKIQPFLYSTAQSLYISYLLWQLNQHIFFTFCHSFLTPFVSMAISNSFLFSCSSSSALWFPLASSEVQNTISEHHKTLLLPSFIVPAP